MYLDGSAPQIVSLAASASRSVLMHAFIVSRSPLQPGKSAGVFVTHPVGCRIVLDHMDDPYAHIPVGSQATVTGVDDAGNVMCAWDCGSSLSLAFCADFTHKIRTEDEAKVTLNWYGTKQPEKDCRCPRCGEIMWGPKARHALSRYVS